MKILKYLGIGLLAIIMVIVVLGQIMPNDYTVTRQITINESKEEVWKYIVSLKKTPEWSPWAELDPEMEVTYEGEDGQVGSKYSWRGNDEVGVGSQEIVEITDNTVKTKLIFVEPFEDQSDAWIEAKEVELNTTQVTWGLKGTMPFPMKVFMDMDAIIGKDYDKGLAKLKFVVENSN